MTFVSYAQNFEDVLLWRAFRPITDGFYIDVGAAHPDTDSVTRAFYDRGWSGINVEPVAEYHKRLTAARMRDINLCAAAGSRKMDGKVYVVAGTGLSTTEHAIAEQHRADALDVRAQDVGITTLADICRDYAPPTIHFLKIDVEGAEQAVLAGADFTTHRPWIILVEATAPGTTTQTHQSWEPGLVAAGYKFLYFDGLNRFYASQERYDQVAPHFATPVCVFDDFMRAADTEWARRVSHAELQAADLLERSMAVDASVAMLEQRSRQSEQRAHDAELRSHDAETRVNHTELRMQAVEERVRHAEAQARAWERRAEQAESRNATLLAGLRSAQEDAASLRSSTSWKVTAPVRQASTLGRIALHGGRSLVRRLAARGPMLRPRQALLQNGASGPALVPAAASPGPSLRHAVHQFHAGSAYGDAITNSMLLIRARLRSLGYRSEIFVVHRDEALATDLLLLDDIPPHDDYVLLLHHSMGFDGFERIMALPAPKILIYHNITPPEFFEGLPEVQQYCRLGRTQLAGMRDHVVAALADSEYNAVELLRLGYQNPQACTVLFDLAVMRDRFRPASGQQPGRPFTILFVGRVVESKGQLDLLRAFAYFQELTGKAGRLVLIGRQDGAGLDYARAVQNEIRALGLIPHVEMPGLVSDDELQTHYQQADLYVSLSRHEGFGVPLVEAALAGVPVLAWPSGAVAFTLGDQGGVLSSRSPEIVGRRMARLAQDPEARAALAQAQRDAASRFELDRQMPILLQALQRAGAASTPGTSSDRLLVQNLRFEIAGHVNSTYSLATINRRTARLLQEARPGNARLIPVEEGKPAASLDLVPPEDAALVAELAGIAPFESGPVVTISQHYPVFVPAAPGDVLLAFLFWEESLLPAQTVATLNAHFQAVLAPTHAVEKALLESGVEIPVHVTGFAPHLSGFLPGTRAVTREKQEHVFLHVSSAFPRKGVDVLLRAYAQAFRSSDPVRLIIKTFPNPHNTAAAMIDAMRKDDPGLPRIDLIDRDVSEDEMRRLYAEADTVVLPTRGEGYNLPAAEAMAASVPLIVTGHGGHMDFCTAENSRLLTYRLLPSASHVSANLSLWAEPDTDDLAAAMREQIEAPDRAQARARIARDAIQQAADGTRFLHRIERAALHGLRHARRARLRLAVISSWNVRCGIAEYSRFLLESLQHAEPALDILMLSDSRPETVHAMRVRTRQVWGLGSAHAPAALQSAVAMEDPDAVIMQHQPGLLPWATLGAALLALASPNRPVLVTLHNTAHLMEVDQDDRTAAIKGLSVATRVIVHSVADIHRLQDLGLTRNVMLMPHGALPPLAARSDPNLSATSTVTIGSYGFLLKDKGLPELIEAVGHMRQTWPRIKLRLVNAEYGDESKPVIAACRAAVQAAGLGSAVELITDYLPTEESRRLLGECDVIVLPYQQSKEGASGALRIALSTGSCVAVTPLPLFDDALGAVYRLPGVHPADIAAGLQTLLADRGLRARIKDQADAWLQERRWDRVGTRTLGMIRGLLAAHADP